MTPDKMKDARALVARARELDSKATPGPWFGVTSLEVQTTDHTICVDHLRHHESLTSKLYRQSLNNMEFIGQSRQLVPDLTAALERVLADLEAERRERASSRKEVR